jgi:dienelactone hydrolase
MPSTPRIKADLTTSQYVARHHSKAGEGPKIDVGYFAHPSFVDEDELRSFRGPLSIAAAETDTIFPAEKRYRTETILKEKGDPYEITLYSGTEHGFAVRGDISVKQIKYAKEQAFKQAVQWFDNWLL